jgi:hypothetical protein
MKKIALALLISVGLSASVLAQVPNNNAPMVPNASPNASGGTVTSVGLALPSSIFTVAGSPVTGSGTLTGTFITQAANTVFAGPTTGAAATPAFRALVSADLPIATTLVPGAVQPDGTTITINGSGVIVAALPTGANPTATAGPAAVNGTAATFMRSDAAPAIQKGLSTQFGIVECDNTTVTCPGGVLTAAAGVGPFLPLAGGTMAGNIAMGGNNISGGGAITGTQFTSTIASGTPPFIVTSPTVVANLNASSLNGATFANPGAIGSGTAATSVAASGPISVTLGTITTNIKGINITATWNASGTTFDAPLFVNVTNTASASGSLLADLQVGGASQFYVDKGGNGKFNNSLLVGSGLSINFEATGAQTSAAGMYSWGTTAAVAPDTALCRVSAGIVEIGTTACNASGSLNLTNLTATGASITFSGLATGTGSYVCATAGLLTVEATACPASDLAQKNPLGSLNIDAASARLDVMPVSLYTYKDTKTYGAAERVGLYAQDVEKMDPRCVTYKSPGEPASGVSTYDDRCVIAYLVAAEQATRHQFADYVRAHP